MPQPVPMPVSLKPSSSTIAYLAQPPSASYNNPPSTATQTPISTSTCHKPYTITPSTISNCKRAVSRTFPTRHQTRSWAWSPQDDGTLLWARAQGRGWTWIQLNFFPNKTPNACRKRHLRLMGRKCADDRDECKMQRMAMEYMSMREEIWGPLAQRTGEEWNVIEQKCMSCGIEGLQTAARTHARHERLGSGQPQPHDDSDVNGISSHMSYSLPENISGGGTSGSTASQGVAYSTAAPPIPMQGSYQRYYGGAGHRHGYISSTSYVGTAQGPTSGSGPHVGYGNRLSGVDVGGGVVNWSLEGGGTLQ